MKLRRQQQKDQREEDEATAILACLQEEHLPL